MNGGIITHNSTSMNGGGVLVYAKATFTFNDGEISYNHAGDNEGAISMSVPSYVYMNGGIITQNTQVKGTAITPSNSTTNVLAVGGPVKIYNNYMAGTTTQANLTVDGVSQLKITGPLVTEKGAAFIGISTRLTTGKTLTSGLKTNGNVYNYSADMAIWFFSDDDTRRVHQNSTNTELIVNSGSTTFFNVDWQYQLDNSGDWISSNGANEINLTYGQKVTAVRTVTVDTNETAHDWQDGGVTPTHMYMIYCDASGDKIGRASCRERV